jgi:hypothetical protein
MPQVETLNLREYKNAMKGPLTIELYQVIGNALLEQYQVINRRGNEENPGS